MIRIQNVTKYYGDRLAVDDISFNIKKGETVGFLGPNAAGKTTTMRMITGYLMPTRGDVWIADYNMATHSLDGRRLIWSFLDGDCKDGVWYEESGQICFIYEDRLDPQCWTFAEGPNGLIARFENDSEATELYEAQDIGEDMLCYGPDVGV